MKHTASTKVLAAAIAVLGATLLEQVSANGPKDSKHHTRFAGVTWDNDAWTLTSSVVNNSDWHAQSFVSNGYIGSSFASSGPFPYIYSTDGGQWWLHQYGTFGTVAGFFDREPITLGAVYPGFVQYGWDSVISGLPCWGPLVLDLGNGVYLDGSVNSDELSNVALRQDFKKGSANYAYTWTPSSLDGFSVDVSFIAVADKLHPNRAYVQLNLTSSSPMDATVVNILDGLSARRTDFHAKGVEGDYLYSAVSPNGVGNITGWVYATLDGTGVDMSTLKPAAERPYINNHSSTIAQSVDVSLQPHKTISLTKYVGIASNDAFDNPSHTAYSEMMEGKKSGFATAFQQHVREWAAVLPEDSVTSFADPVTGETPEHLIDRQITSVVAAAMLLMNTVSENALEYVNNAPINVWGIPVCGLTADCYAGQIFWDMDIFMGPYIAATHPFEAKQIALPRTTLYEQAAANIQAASRSPTQGNTDFSPQAVIYPWSTGRDGNCTATGPCWDFEYHINGDIVKGFTNYWAATGDDDFFESSLLPITNSVAALFSDLIQFDSSTNKWVLMNMTDPDEYAMNVNNGAFTMALIQWTLRSANFFNGLYGKSENSTWDKQASALEIPFNEDQGITLEYTGMNGSISVKQADVILRTYPLDNHENYSIENQLADLDYYAAKQSQDGPGMTYAIFSIGASALKPPGCAAYTYDKYAWGPYVRAPWFQFSEQIDDFGSDLLPAFPFLTGFGGFLQVDLMGYLGLRYGTSFHITISPNLPPQIPYMRLPIFYFHGWPIQAEMNQTHTALVRLGTPLSTANMTFADSGITVRVRGGQSDHKSFELSPNGILVLENDDSSKNLAIDNNILQCRPIIASNGTVLPGQFVEGAIDGSNSTSWQAVSCQSINSITADLSGDAFAPVKSIHINWATAVASNFSVIFHNTSDHTAGVDSKTIDVPDVKISIPYNPSEQSIVRHYLGNTTTIDLTGKNVWTGRYATLLVTGNQGDMSRSAPGASVAEWAVLV
ncbi:acid trehalase [Aspergillus sclerotialis]|uniref:alpha,alpha-trehalase n=1 Tax=Aspergillus sclerotialis TaxID=2070753 RepID=A0A3A2ZJN6_9EURO|nr:acid trehalase [Aspergillus sclerotialis]